MKQKFLTMQNLQVPLGSWTIVFGRSWLLTIPIGLWAINAIYLPIYGPFLNTIEQWILTSVIAVLGALSLIGHAMGHRWVTKLIDSDSPPRLSLYPLGDAAQVWPAAPTVWREVGIALAGPIINLIIAGGAYLLWEMQLHPSINLITLFLAFFNGGLVVVNLTPVFPLDGGRLTRVIGWGLLGRPILFDRLGQPLGFVLALLFVVWGLILIGQRARFSWPTGGGTLFFAALLLTPLLVQPFWTWDRGEPARPTSLSMGLFRLPLAGLLLLGLLSTTLSLVPMNNGLEAPGVTPAIEPMVEVPAQQRYQPEGQFLLTTVFAQTPITVGQWIFGQLSPAVKLVPPERIVPIDTTVEEIAQRSLRLLDNSQPPAIVVGLRLAGYEVETTTLGVVISSVLSESPANQVLQAGDIIIGLNGQTIGTVADLLAGLKQPNLSEPIRLKIDRAGQIIKVETPLMPRTEPDQPPRIGIGVEEAGFEADLPFPVEINPQKISGGPSAGLMFALTVYNLVTFEDLTGGRIIAGTGTINLDGTVGPIGGVQQKVAGATLAGAEYFLSPPENYEDAKAVAHQIKVVKVATAEEAVEFLQSLPAVEAQR